MLQLYMDFYSVDKAEAETRIAESPLHAHDTSDLESDLYDSDD